MGYVNLKDICQFIPPAQIVKTEGTWTPTLSGSLISEVRTAAAGGFYMFLPIKLPASHSARQCAKLKSVDIWYKVGVAAMADMAAVEVKKLTLPATGVAVSGAAYTAFTIDADHDTAAERKALGDHKMTLTFTDAPYLEDDEALIIVLTCEAAVTSVLTLLGAQVNYELRM